MEWVGRSASGCGDNIEKQTTELRQERCTPISLMYGQCMIFQRKMQPILMTKINKRDQNAENSAKKTNKKDGEMNTLRDLENDIKQSHETKIITNM